jgi:hypothetical protein
MSTLQNLIDQLHPMAAFAVMGCTFLIAGIGGWYAGALVLWLIRGKQT